LLVLLATDVSGVSDGIGGGAAASWFVLNGVALRLGAGMRAGAVSVASTNTLTISASAGVAFHAWRATPSRPIGASLRADYVVVRESATNCMDGPGSTDCTSPRLRSGIDGYIDGDWLFAHGAEIVLGVGLEDVLASTEVTVLAGNVRATIPPLRVVGEAGVRLRF
jgi:hypothetical protein